MLKHVMSMSFFQWYSAIAMAIFFLFSLGIFIWIQRPGSKKIYEKMAKLPLD